MGSCAAATWFPCKARTSDGNLVKVFSPRSSCCSCVRELSRVRLELRSVPFASSSRLQVQEESTKPANHENMQQRHTGMSTHGKPLAFVPPRVADNPESRPARRAAICILLIPQTDWHGKSATTWHSPTQDRLQLFRCTCAGQTARQTGKCDTAHLRRRGSCVATCGMSRSLQGRARPNACWSKLPHRMQAHMQGASITPGFKRQPSPARTRR